MLLEHSRQVCEAKFLIKFSTTVQGPQGEVAKAAESWSYQTSIGVPESEADEW